MRAYEATVTRVKRCRTMKPGLVNDLDVDQKPRVLFPYINGEVLGEQHQQPPKNVELAEDPVRLELGAMGGRILRYRTGIELKLCCGLRKAVVLLTRWRGTPLAARLLNKKSFL